MSEINKVLNTMELIHYIEKFKDKIFILVFRGKTYIRDIIPDIIILQSFNIKTAIVLGYDRKNNSGRIENIFSDKLMEISGMLRRNNLDPMISLGTEIYSKRIETDGYGEITGFDQETIEFALEKNKIPIFAPMGIDIRGNYHLLNENDVAMELATTLDADQIFMITDNDIIDIENKKYKFLTYDLVEKLLQKKLSPEQNEILKYGLRLMDRGIKNLSLLKGNIGNIYKEVLTYDISGTLISRVDDENIRQATIDDISSIYLLIKNEMEKNNILPIQEEYVEKEIDKFLVFDIDGSVVAAGKLNYYGNAAEIAKIVTLPRYQGGKKAREICHALIEKAENEKLDEVFGLTVNSAMMRLFESLGFEQIDREKLNNAWKKQYDFSRPSHAFRRVLKEKSNVSE